MKERLTPMQWAEHLNKYIKHNSKFGSVLLCGMRIKCDENSNLMLLIQDNKLNSETNAEYFWVYDYDCELYNQ